MSDDVRRLERELERQGRSPVDWAIEVLERADLREAWDPRLERLRYVVASWARVVYRAPCACLDEAAEFSSWQVGEGAWELCALLPDGRPCCSFLPSSREGQPWRSEAEALSAARELSSQRRKLAVPQVSEGR